MSNEDFKQKMAALEKERDNFIAQLTPEGQQDYLQKQQAYNQQAGNYGPDESGSWTNNNAAANINNINDDK